MPAPKAGHRPRSARASSGPNSRVPAATGEFIQTMMAWGILVAGAVLLGILWPAIPPTWAIHFDLRGQPNGWAHKSFFGVYFPLLLGVFIVGTTQLLKPLGRSTKSPYARTPEDAQKLSEMNDRSVDLICNAMASIMVVFAVVLPLRPDLILAAGLYTVAAIIVATLLIVREIRRTMKEVGVPKGFTGIAYNNADDPRLWVPKLSGLGWTLNFAHPWAWPIMIGLLVLPVGTVLLVLFQALKLA